MRDFVSKGKQNEGESDRGRGTLPTLAATLHAHPHALTWATRTALMGTEPGPGPVVSCQDGEGFFVSRLK